MSRVPRIRFKGFEEDWEQRKVGAICSISTGKSNTQDRVEDGKYPFYVRSSIVERSNRYLFDEEAVLTVGDGVGTGKVFHYVDGKYDLHQRVYRMFDFEKDISAKYFFYYLSKNFYDRVMAMTAKTSVDSVRYEVIADMDIIVPHIKEQKFIADIFQNFDYLITLHQRKLEKLKIIKKSMLENLFPQNGEKTPKIRFSGFTEDWEQRKLGEMVEFYNGDRSSRYPNDSDMVFDGIPFINAGDLVLGRVKLDTTNKITEEKYNQLSGAKIQCGDIIYCLRGTLGKNAFVDNFDIGTIASSLVDIRPQKIVGKYLFQVLNSDIEYSQRILNDEGAAQPNLSAKNLYLFDIPIPRDAEQIKIAEYLELLDHLITLHQSKLDKLQKIKKSMLESMFV